jgi:predicted ATP-grasp superfamily ATP-dependent carboligase
MTIRKLAIVGASARAAAFSAIRAGYEVVAADLFADADLQRVANVARIENYPVGLADWLAATECDAWLYTGALENYPDLVDRMAALKPLLGNGGEALRRVRDPLALRAVLADGGVQFPETRASADGLPRDGSWLCKTYRGASGSGVWRLDGEAALDCAIRERAVFQRFVPGRSAAALFVVSPEGAIPVGVTRLLVGGAGRDWQYVGSIGPEPELLSLAHDVAWMKWFVAIGDVLANQIGLRGIVGVDLVLGDGVPWVLEINPRYTASVEVLERAGARAVLAAHVAACSADHDKDAIAKSVEFSRMGWGRTFAKTILFAPREALVTPAFFEWAISQSSRDFDCCRLADIPSAGEVIPAGRPVLTAFAAGDSSDACEAELAQRLAEVTTRLYDS